MTSAGLSDASVLNLLTHYWWTLGGVLTES